MAILLSNDIVATFPSDFKLVHFYSVGRCGSTLLCKAMDATEHCQSLSEPDVFTILSRYTMKQSKMSLIGHQNKLVSIIKAALILLAHYCLLNKPSKKVVILKYRSNCILGAQPIQKAYPLAKTIFLYRDAISHNESFTRAFIINNYWKYWLYTTLRIDTPPWQFSESMCESGWGDMDDLMTGVFNYSGRHGYVWTSFCFWISSIEAAARLHQEDPEHFFHFIADYATLIEQKDTCLKKLCHALGIEFQEDDVRAIEKVFAKNSQEGTTIQSNKMGKSSDVWYGDWERNILMDIMKYHNGIADHIDYTFK